MRTLTRHKTPRTDLNQGLTINADDRDPHEGNASHLYTVIVGGYPPETIRFQRGAVKECGLNGISDEALLTILIDRLEGFQESKWGCQENGHALIHLMSALMWLQDRTRKRQDRGVEGTSHV